MIKLNIDFSNALQFIDKNEIYAYQNECYQHLTKLKNKTGKGNDFLGWIDLPQNSDDIINSVLSDSRELASKSDFIVVVGIGGSYLGAKSVIEALSNHFSEFVKSNFPKIIYAGQNISEDYLKELLDLLNDHDYSIVVISKSGTTTEPAIAFRLLKRNIETKYGKEKSKERIVAITDLKKGALKELSNKERYKSYVIPDDVGGRYSVFSPVGLLPIALAGFDIQEFIQGAEDMRNHIFNENTDFQSNQAMIYAACRNVLYKKGYTNEIMVSYEPRLTCISEWWKQLYGESEGKENKGIFPASVNFTTDLHSMGQYIQEGLRNLFETVISVKSSKSILEIPKDDANLDKLNYISGKRISEVNQMAEVGTTLAHIDGGVPNLQITIPEIKEYFLGQLMYFFEVACAISGYMLKVNPFDQPGVEAYKKNMFALLGKPGFEDQTKEINRRRNQKK